MPSSPTICKATAGYLNSASDNGVGARYFNDNATITGSEPVQNGARLTFRGLAEGWAMGLNFDVRFQ